VQALLAHQSQPRQPIALLALRRARFARQTASATVSGVVASLALSVAITVMVASFRDAVLVWLDSALPADIYARSSASAASADQVFLPPGFAERVSHLPGVARVQTSRGVPLQLQPQQPAVTLVARQLGEDPAATLPMLGAVLPVVEGELAVFVSEPAAALYGWTLGQRITLPLRLAGSSAPSAVPVRIRGVWRDYARQFGAIAIEAADYQRLTGDDRANDLALWLAAGAAPAEVEAALHAAAGPDLPRDIASTASLRTLSLRIFDRSFAVTFYLQAVAIVVGLVGVAASLSAQVLARRKEFGLLAHLGLTRRQVIALVGAEAAAWLLAGTLIGLTLGLAMAVVLVKVVNPQSFHWTMPLQLPLPRLAALAGAVLAAGIATALWSARRAAGRAAVLAVKEDW
jgi:putative ABC transport system permease protein